MKRRRLIFSVLGLLGAPGVAHAQAARAPGKIGYLHPRSIAPDSSTLKALRPVWQKLGYVDGQTVLLRSAEGDERRLPGLVSELIGLGVGALIVVGAVAVRAASRATRTTPIVAIDLETNPVRAGYAASFNRPGGNVTGLFMDQPALAGKWIDLLREAVPDLQRLAILWDPGTGVDQLEVAKAVARAKGLDAVVIDRGEVKTFDEALRRLGGKPRTSIVVLTSPGFTVDAPSFAAAAQKYRLPAISFLKNHAHSGVLLTYGPIQEDYFPRAVTFADKILRGAKPGELAIEGPDRFEFVLNRKTAKAMRLTIPTQLLLRVDEVID